MKKIPLEEAYKKGTDGPMSVGPGIDDGYGFRLECEEHEVEES